MIESWMVDYLKIGAVAVAAGLPAMIAVPWAWGSSRINRPAFALIVFATTIPLCLAFRWATG